MSIFDGIFSLSAYTQIGLGAIHVPDGITC